MSEFLHIVCGHCDGVNRVPTTKLASGGNCGACKKPLFKGEVLGLNHARFVRHLAKSQLPLVVDFWAPWCGPCKMMAPVFVSAAQSYEPRCRFIKINTEMEKSLSAQYNIRSIPTIIIFKDGLEKVRVAGALDKQNLLAWLQQNL